MRGGGELTGQRAGALAHPVDAVPTRGVRAGSGPVVADPDEQPRRFVRQRQPHGARLGVAEHVGQRFLDDPVGGQVDRGGQRPRVAVDVQLDPQAGGLGRVDAAR